MTAAEWQLFGLSTLALLVVAFGFGAIAVRWLRSEAGEFRRHLEQIQTRLDAHVAKARDDIGSEVGDVKTELGKAETRLEAQVANEIDGLDARIDGVTPALEKDVAGSKQNASSRRGQATSGAEDIGEPGDGPANDKREAERDEKAENPSESAGDPAKRARTIREGPSGT